MPEAVAAKRGLDDITHKALADALKRLERNGLVTRTVLPTAPIGVEYAITPLGHSLRQPFEALWTRALTYGDAIDAANDEHDRIESKAKKPVSTVGLIGEAAEARPCLGVVARQFALINLRPVSVARALALIPRSVSDGSARGRASTRERARGRHPRSQGVPVGSQPRGVDRLRSGPS